MSIGKKYWTRAIGNRIIFIIFLNGKLRKRSLFNINERPWQTSHSSAGMVRNFPELRRCAHPDTGHVSADPYRRRAIILYGGYMYIYTYTYIRYSWRTRVYIIIVIMCFVYNIIYTVQKYIEIPPLSPPSRWPRGEIYRPFCRRWHPSLRPFRPLRAGGPVLPPSSRKYSGGDDKHYGFTPPP